MSKQNKKRHVPNLDINNNPVWKVLTDPDFPSKKKANKKKKKKTGESRKKKSIDTDLQVIFNEIEEKKEFEKAIKKKQKLKKNRRMDFSFFKVTVTILLLLILGIVSVISIKYDRYTVPTDSMADDINKGDKLLFKKNLPINRFNVVLVEKDGKKDLLRVIGMPGDDIKMSNDTLQVNGSFYEESYLKNNFINFKYQEENSNKVYTSNFDTKHLIGIKEESTDIPEKKYYLLGDNRRATQDSRQIGLYDEQDIKGVVSMRIYPINEIGSIH